jgi:hypothetical protein
VQISAHVASSAREHAARVATDGRSQTLSIPPKDTGSGSGVGCPVRFAGVIEC